ncbi:MAG: Vgb family protein [Deferrisomatales bacterium]
MILPALLLWLLLPGVAAALDVGGPPGEVAGFALPFDLAPLPGRGVAVLEDRAGRVLAAPGRGPREALAGLAAPRAVATDEAGLLLVLDGTGDRSRVVAFRDGREAWRVALPADPSPGRPVAAAAREGILWVVDRSPPRLLLYAYTGKSLGWVDLAPLARAPFSVALGPAGEAYLADPMGPGVLRFSPAGSYTGAVNLAGSGITRPTGLAIDPRGRLWVSDGVTGRVTAVDPGGGREELTSGGAPLGFDDPLRLAWREGVLWVLEARAGRVRRLNVEAR